MNTVKEFMKINFDGKKILLPYQFWYPQIDVQRDRVKHSVLYEFIESLSNNSINNKNAMLYIHIPFCNSSCTYCDFEKSYTYSDMNDYVNRIIAEMRKYRTYNYVKNLSFDSIYIGGGTPTLLSTEQINRIIKNAREIFCIDKTKTVNMECSPNTLDEDKITCIKNNGIQRISMGVQSFDESIRKKLNISSQLKDIFCAIELANKHNLDISIDLMYGFGSTLSEELTRLLTDIDIASSLDIASVELNILYPSSLLCSQKKDTIVLSSNEIEIVMKQAFQKLRDKGFIKTSDVTYRKKKDAKFVLDETYYGIANEVPDCIAIGSGALGYINGHRYINAMYSRYMKSNAYITCLKKLRTEERETLKMIGFAKRLFLSKTYKENEFLYQSFAARIEELNKYQILEETALNWIISDEAQFYIDNIFYYMLDDKSKLEMSKKKLIYYFES